jgi:hypothetical protein
MTAVTAIAKPPPIVTRNAVRTPEYQASACEAGSHFS